MSKDKRLVRGTWASTLGVYKKMMADYNTINTLFPLDPPDYVCLVGGGRRGKPKAWRVMIEDDIPDKDKVIETLEKEFNRNATRAEITELWNTYNLWGHIVFLKLTTLKEKRRQDTRAALGGYYQPLLPSNVGCRVIEAMMNASPTTSLIDSELAKPLEAIDKLMIYAIAVQFGNMMDEIEATKGAEAAKRCRDIIQTGGGEKYLRLSIVIDMKFLADRTVDAFKRTQWRADQDVKELQERLLDSVKKLTKPFKATFKDIDGRMVERSFRFIAPTAENDGKYQVCSLFAFMDSYYYEKVDFNALCDGYKELGEVFLNLKSVLGANRARLSRKNSKPIEIDGLSLFSEEELKAIEDKSVTPETQRKRKSRALAKVKKAIEKADDKADIKINRRGKITISPTATEDSPTTDESKKF